MSLLNKIRFGRRDPVLGYACRVRNAARQVQLYGAPLEICETLRRKDALDVLGETASEIAFSAVYQDEPRLEFDGSPDAPVIIELLEAIAEDDLQTFRRLIENPGNIFEPSAGVAHVPLLAAASSNRPAFVEALIAHLPSIDLEGDLGLSALDWSAILGLADVAQILQDAGANTAHQSWFFLTAAEVAEINGHGALARQLNLGNFPKSEEQRMQMVLERMRSR